MSKKLSIDFIREAFKDRGVELLSTEYKNNSQLLEYRCKQCGNVATISWINFKAGKNKDMLCQNCSTYHKNPSLIYPSIKEEFLSKGAILLSTEYKNNNSPLYFKCSKCGAGASITYRSYKSGSNQNLLCKDCLREEVREKVSKQVNPDMISIIREEFASRGANLLTENYENNRQKLFFECSNCGEVHSITWHDFKQGNNNTLLCEICYSGQLYKPNSMMSNCKRDRLDFYWFSYIKEFYNISANNKNFSSHHIRPWSSYPEYRLSIGNGFPLKREDHVHNYTYFHRNVESLNPENWPVKYRLSYQKYKDFKFHDFNSVFINTILSEECLISEQLKIKKQYADEGIFYIPFFIDEFLFESKRKISLSMIKQRLSKYFPDIYKYTNTKFNKIFARKCEIVVMTYTEAKDFFNRTHIMGFCNANIYLGLKYQGKIVSAMSFGHPRAKQRNCDYEIIRFSSELDTVVVGASSKLFKYFITKYNPHRVVSYCDIRFSSVDPTDTVYPKLGFNYVDTTSPNYRYLDPATNVTYSRQHFQKHKLSKLISNFDPKLSEHENMKNNGYIRLYDCGNYVFIWSNE